MTTQTEEVESFPESMNEYLQLAGVNGKIVVEHRRENDDGKVVCWSEVLCTRTDGEGGRQIAHCVNREDAELIAKLLTRELEAFA